MSGGPRTRWSDGTLHFAYTRIEELDAIASMLAKARVCEHVYFGPNTRAETRAFFLPLLEPMRASLACGSLPEVHVFTIRHGPGEDFVGECAVVPVAYAPGNFTIGYQLDEPWWRQGIGTRAGEFLVWYGFARLGAYRLNADCLASNLGSARILERCGFRREGLQRRHYRVRGEYRDQLLFGLLREELRPELEDVGARYGDALRVASRETSATG
ncbi:MAG: GNAT family N-acetyltransferase [Myxococcales bacterium]|nr:GNAT family N-acetyltransferase [Myxococcales bacterium]